LKSVVDSVFPESLYSAHQASIEEDLDIESAREFLKNKCADIVVNSLKDLTQTEDISHVIRVTDERPIRHKLRKIPFNKRDEVKKMLDDMFAAKLIQPSVSAWSSPLCLVGKPDGSIRITIDYRELNKVTVKDAFPVPNIDCLLTRLTRAKFFSKFDLSNGYFQIKLDPSSRHYTTFSCEFGHFEL
ncbi:unnamed protein product, partial [Brachionus calyciflorus]